jgi:hypothetical protein
MNIVSLRICILYLLAVSGYCQASGGMPQSGRIEGPEHRLLFTENLGQVKDQSGNGRPDVLFYGNDRQMGFFVRSQGISYQLQRDLTFRELDCPSAPASKKRTAETCVSYRVDLEWLNANKSPVVKKGAVVNGIERYYRVGDESLRDAASYADFELKELYDGISVHYYEQKGHLKHDYLVSAGANYRQIKLRIYGAKPVIDENGSIIMHTPLGDIVEAAPVAFQNGHRIDIRWTVKDNEIGFEIAGFDPTQALVIDPLTRAWGTYYGGTSGDQVNRCATDQAGNAYLVGFTGSASNIATTGAHQTTLSAGYDAMLVKFNSSGVRQWATYYGGSGWDVAYACSFDASGNIYLVGATTSTSGISTSGAYQASFGGSYDAFLVKFDNTGVRQWATYYGAVGSDYGHACFADGNGDIYFSGSTTSTAGISTSGAFQQSYAGNWDGFIAKFSSAGSRLWATYYGGGSDDFGNSVATDNSGNVFLAGAAWSSSGISSTGSFQSANGGFVDGYLAKFSSSGVRLWATYYGGSQSDYLSWNRVDASGDILIVGITQSSAGIASIGGYQTSPGGQWDIMSAKFDTNGNRVWGTYYGGAGSENDAFGALGSSGDIFISGHTTSTVGLATAGAWQTVFGGGNTDAFLARFSPAGQLHWSTYYGGPQEEWDVFEDGNLSCAVDNNGNTYLAGNTTSTAGIASAGAFQQTLAGNFDAFLVKFNCSILGQARALINPVCVGGNLSFTTSAYTNSIINYSWSGPSAFSSTLANPAINGVQAQHAGTYTLQAGDGTGCNETVLITVTVGSNPTVSLNSGTLCQGSSFTLTPSGAGTYTYLNGGPVVSPATNMTYSVTGTSSLGCLATNTAVATLTALPAPSITVNSGSVCAGQIFTLVAGGASTYSFSGGSNMVSPAFTTSYSVSGTSTAGCISQNSAVSNITVYPSPTVTVNSGSVCAGEMFTLSPAGAFSYTYSGGSNTVVPFANTSYSVTGTSVYGCVSQSAALSHVTVNANPTITANSGSICAGQSFTIVPNGAQTYSVSGGSSIVSPANSTTYFVTGTSSAGCTSQSAATSNLIVHPNPTVVVNSGSICAGQVFTIHATGAVSYTYSGGSTVSPASTSSYSVTGTSTAGCISPSAAISTVTVAANPTVTVNSNKIQICAGEGATLTAGGAVTFTADGQAFNSTLAVTPGTTTQYTVAGTAANGCMSAVSITQSVSPCAAITNYAGRNCFTAYPNPCPGGLWIESDLAVEIAITDCLGHLVKRENVLPGRSQINLTELTPGVYFLRAASCQAGGIIKVFKQ